MHPFGCKGAQWYNHTPSSRLVEQGYRTFCNVSIEVPAHAGFIDAGEQLVDPLDLGILDIRWVANNHIEAATLHDFVELNIPMKRLVTLSPLLESRSIIHIDSILLRQKTIE